jgi:GDP-4-dehydro-6-deoxy-D-mannose reductase
MPRALVTGASGFVGPHLCAALAAGGHDVWTTDRSPLSPSPAGGVHRPTRLAAARHTRCDLGDADAVLRLVESVQPEWVFHLASHSSVAHSFEHPQEVLVGNLGSTCNVLEAVRTRAPAAKVLVVGSAEQYGMVPENEQPIREAQPFRPASPYAVSKVAQEYLALQYAAAWGLAILVVRSFNHSGPGQSDRFVLPAFARQIAACEYGLQEPVLRVGNLDVWRDFLDVRDVVRAYLLLLERGEPGAAYNVCRGEAFRIHDLLDGLLARAQVALRVETDPARWRPADLRMLRGDPGRLRTGTGWQPELAMETTLGDLLEDWRVRVTASGGS